MTGILIIARLGSTRLKRKHLIEVNERTFMEWLILRIQSEFGKEIEKEKVKIVIATSDEKANREFEAYANKLKCEVFYGSIHNIPQRQLECVKQYNFSSVISVDGDDILFSTKAMRNVFSLLSIVDQEIIKTTGLPLGMNVTGYSASVLENAVSKAGNITKLETGWGSIFKGINNITYHFSEYANTISSIRMTLDYELDSEFFKTVISEFNQNILSITDSQLINCILTKKYDKINDSLNEEYWINFNKEKQI